MGAWGHGSFDNDTAMDWAGEVADAAEGIPADGDDETLNKEALIIGPLAALVETPEDEQPDADLACEAIAAAEIIAAVFGKPSKDLTEAATEPEAEGNTLGQIMAWLTKTESPMMKWDDLRELARDALDRTLTSELSELWEESDSAEAWKEAVADLRLRLA